MKFMPLLNQSQGNLTLPLFTMVALGLFSACSKSAETKSEEPPAAQETQVGEVQTKAEDSVVIGDGGNGLNLAPAAPAFLSAELEVVGQTITPNLAHKVLVAPSISEGAVMECAVIPRGAIANANTVWQDCSTGFSIPAKLSVPDGHYELNARSKFPGSTATSEVAKKPIYVNSSLSDAEKCEEFTSEEKVKLFNYAKTMLIADKFGSTSDFTAPKMKFVYADGDVNEISTLRRSLTLNEDKSLALVTRKYKSSRGSDCHAIKYVNPVSGRRNTADALVISGSGGCVLMNYNKVTMEVSYKQGFSKDKCFVSRGQTSRFTSKANIGDLDYLGQPVQSGFNPSTGVIGIED